MIVIAKTRYVVGILFFLVKRITKSFIINNRHNGPNPKIMLHKCSKSEVVHVSTKYVYVRKHIHTTRHVSHGNFVLRV